MTTYTIEEAKCLIFSDFGEIINKLQKEVGYSGISGIFMLVTGGDSLSNNGSSTL